MPGNVIPQYSNGITLNKSSAVYPPTVEGAHLTFVNPATLEQTSIAFTADGATPLSALRADSTGALGIHAPGGLYFFAGTMGVPAGIANITLTGLKLSTSSAAAALAMIDMDGAMLLVSQAADPAAQLTGVMLYAKDVAGVKCLFARKSNGTVVNLTP